MNEPTGVPQGANPRNSDDDALTRILTAIGLTPPEVYAPADDSFLMIDVLAHIPVARKQVLDMGTGSGILGLYCAMRDASVTASDIDAAAMEQAARAAKSLGVELMLVVSDLFSNISGRFDLILFNPPYLPSRGFSDRSVDGGPRGISIAHRFLNNLRGYLKPEGEALLLLSSLNNPTSVQEQHGNFEFSVLARRSFFFEELEVLRVRFRDNLAVQ